MVDNIYIKMHNLTSYPRMQIKTMRNYAHHNIKGNLAWMLNNRNIYLLLMTVGYFLENNIASRNKVEHLRVL